MTHHAPKELLRPFARHIKAIDRCLRRLLKRILTERQVLGRLSEPVILSEHDRDGVRLIVALVPLLDLRPREREIAALVGRGLGNEGIARKLRISRDTVKTHLKDMFRQYGFESRAAVARYAAFAFREEENHPKG